MLLRKRPDGIHVTFDDHCLVANADCCCPPPWPCVLICCCPAIPSP